MISCCLVRVAGLMLDGHATHIETERCSNEGSLSRSVAWCSWEASWVHIKMFWPDHLFSDLSSYIWATIEPLGIFSWLSVEIDEFGQVYHASTCFQSLWHLQVDKQLLPAPFLIILLLLLGSPLNELRLQVLLALRYLYSLGLHLEDLRLHFHESWVK